MSTDEPGIYEEGDFGIRIENNLLTVKGEKNKYGQFMHFETLNFVPIDLDGIDPEELTRSEREWLNDYHKDCYEKVSRIPHRRGEGMAQGVHQSHLIRNPTLSANERPVQLCTAGPLGHLEFRK